jgi:MFS family permease
MLTARKSSFYGWKLLIVFCVMFFVNVGLPTYAATIVNVYMAGDLHLSRKMLGSIFSLFQLMVGLPGPMIAYCVRKNGVSRTLVMGSLLVLTGSMVMPFLVHTGWQAVVGFGLIIGLGAAAGGSLPAQAAITNWFVKKRALALSIKYAGGGLGGFFAVPLLNWFIAKAGGNWRVGWWLLAALAAGAAVVSAIFVKEHPSELGQFADGAPANLSTPAGSRPRARSAVYQTLEDWTFSEALRTRTLWLLILATFGVSMGTAMFTAHGVVHLKGIGYSSAAAAMSISVLAISMMIGRLAASLGDRIEPRFLWAVAMALHGLGLIWAFRARGVVDLYLYAVLLGLGSGLSMVCMMTIPANYFGSKAYPSIIGLVMTTGTTIAAIAPVVAGYLYDISRSYGTAFYSIAAICFASSVLVLGVTPPRRRVRTRLAGQQAVVASAAE